jgi:hypothetical protein
MHGIMVPQYYGPCPLRSHRLRGQVISSAPYFSFLLHHRPHEATPLLAATQIDSLFPLVILYLPRRLRNAVEPAQPSVGENGMRSVVGNLVIAFCVVTNIMKQSGTTSGSQAVRQSGRQSMVWYSEGTTRV